jgi:hypothetical protein
VKVTIRLRLSTSALLALTLFACEKPATKSAIPVVSRSPAVLSNDNLLTGDSVGSAIVGVTQAALSSRVHFVRDTIELGMEAIPESIAVVVVGADTIRGAIDSGRIYRFSVESERFRTVDSLGVGSTLARFLSEPGLYAITGEGAVFLQSPRHCGLSFRLAEAGELGDAPDSVGFAELLRLPPTTPIAEILVLGCKRRNRAAHLGI